MYLIQILLVIFFVFAVLKVAGRYKHGDISILSAIVWWFFWLAAAWVVIAPNSTAYFAKILGVGRGADLVVYVSLVAIFFIIFRLMIKVEKQNKEITLLVRQLALKNKD